MDHVRDAEFKVSQIQQGKLTLLFLFIISCHARIDSIKLEQSALLLAESRGFQFLLRKVESLYAKILLCTFFHATLDAYLFLLHLPQPPFCPSSLSLFLTRHLCIERLPIFFLSPEFGDVCSSRENSFLSTPDAISRAGINRLAKGTSPLNSIPLRGKTRALQFSLGFSAPRRRKGSSSEYKREIRTG